MTARLTCWIVILFSLCFSLHAFAAEQNQEKLHLAGSDTIGGQLAPAIAVAFRAKYAPIPVAIDALGSATAFVALFNGSADIGNSSRPINEKEVQTARDLNVHLVETVIAYDGVAVIVNPSNTIKEISVDDLSKLFTGQITNWKKLGGPDLPVKLLSRPNYSGTYSFFKEKALRKGNAKGPEDFAPSTQIVEANPDIIKIVASDPGAVSYVGMGWIKPEIHVVPVKGTSKTPAVAPTAESVRNGTYPLYRPLFMYLPENPRPVAVAFVKFTLSKEGAAIISDNGFVPLDNPTLPPTLARVADWIPASRKPEVAAMQASATVTSPTSPQVQVSPAVQVTTKSNINLRVTFPFGAAVLTQESKETLELAIDKLKSHEFRAVVIGHADSQGSPDINQKIAKARAQAVAEYFTGQGINQEELEINGQGSDQPIATNTTTSGRAQNRRVDIELIPR